MLLSSYRKESFLLLAFAFIAQNYFDLYITYVTSKYLELFAWEFTLTDNK